MDLDAVIDADSGIDEDVPQYARKRAEGKAKMNALGHCMKKALSLVWGIWRGGDDFAPEPPKPLTTGYGT